MKSLTTAVACLIATVCAVVHAAPAQAQAQAQAQAPAPAPAKPQVVIEYGPPGEAYRAIYDRLKQRRVLERLQQFLSPLKLTRDLKVQTAVCGNKLSIPYKAGQPVTICYEYVALIEKVAPEEAERGAISIGTVGRALVTREIAIVGPFVQAVLHDVARAVLDMLEIPVWGNAEDAADHVAAFLMLQFGPDVAQKTIFGTAYFLNKTSPDTIEFASLRPHTLQRYYNLLCIAVGHDLVKYGMFVPLDREATSGDLPKNRIGNCIAANAPEHSEYNQVKFAFGEVILKEHVDLVLLKQVMATDWLKDD